MKLEILEVTNETSRISMESGGACFTVSATVTLGFWAADVDGPRAVRVIEIRNGAEIGTYGPGSYGVNGKGATVAVELDGMCPGEIEWVDIPPGVRALLPPDWDVAVQSAMYVAAAAGGQLTPAAWDLPS